MSITVSKIIEDVKLLSAKDRAFLARYLIFSLDTTQDENADEKWAIVAKNRYEELKSGIVNPLLWDEIKKEVIS